MAEKFKLLVVSDQDFAVSQAWKSYFEVEFVSYINLPEQKKLLLFDVILLHLAADQQTPLLLTRALRKNLPPPALPIMGLLPHADRDLACKAFEAGMTSCLIQSPDDSLLLAQLKSWAEVQRQNRLVLHHRQEDQLLRHRWLELQKNLDQEADWYRSLSTAMQSTLPSSHCYHYQRGSTLFAEHLGNKDHASIIFGQILGMPESSAITLSLALRLQYFRWYYLRKSQEDNPHAEHAFVHEIQTLPDHPGAYLSITEIAWDRLQKTVMFWASGTTEPAMIAPGHRTIPTMSRNLLGTISTLGGLSSHIINYADNARLLLISGSIFFEHAEIYDQKITQLQQDHKTASLDSWGRSLTELTQSLLNEKDPFQLMLLELS